MFQSWKDRVRLEGVLAGLAVSMSLAGRLHPEFREDLKERNGIAEIRTSDWGVAWNFRMAHGTLRGRRGGHPNPDYAMVYRDAAAAVHLLTEGTDEAFMQGMADGAVRFEGDLAFGMWFNDLLKKVGKIVKARMETLSLKRSAR